MQRFTILGLTIVAAIALPLAPARALSKVVATYHYDNLRTGWNRNETILTPANVGPSTFGVLSKVVLDDQVDAQPLVVPSQQIIAGSFTLGSPGTYEVVYVATEANTVYAINSANGAVLAKRNLGTAVLNPVTCGTNSPNVGIKSTPVIDMTTKTLYVIAYTLISGTPTYQLFALNLKDLTDRIAPVTVAASHTLSDGTTYNFNAAYQRQRPALLESSGVIPLGLHSSGNIYAAFGSFCDFNTNQSRGWVLGWRASTLTPLPVNELTDTLATGSFFLSSIWMSGYGIAADPTGNLFFSTGNSATGTYDGVRNIQESVVKLDPQLGNLLDIFTPSNENSLDAADEDVSAGGVLLLPPQPGSFPNLAVATAKSGNMYLLNRNNLGGFTPGGPDKVLDTKTIGPCWCGPSYFTGSDGIGRVVSSGCSGCTTTSGATLAQITVWKVQTSPTVAFVQEGAALPVASGQDGGTFTAVSSNGTMAGTTVIWATGEPVDSNPAAVNLYAFGAAPSGGTLPLLYSSRAGSWPFTGANANIVPVVANGKVYVASNKQLTIFGLGGHSFAASAAAAAGPAAGNTQESPHQVTGVLQSATGTALALRTRAGTIARLDDSEALRKKQTSVLVPGKAYTAQGTYDSTGALHASTLARAKGSPALWPPDR
ncbi:MAG TPA: hypothetical protein VIF02_03250 [Methylocella sp.]